MKKISLIASILFIGVTTFAQKSAKDTVNNKFGKGIYNVVAKDNSYSLKFDIRIQSLFTGQWDVNEDDGIGNADTRFLIRRARLKFGGHAYTPKLKYKVELGLTNRDISGASPFTSGAPRVILDAVVKWNFYKNFTLWAGQTKLPGNRERVVSSANLQLVDRSLLNSNYNIDRDVGLQLRHHFTLGENFLVREIVSFSQGEGRNITSPNLGGYQYTGRVEVLPFGKFASKGDYKGSDLKREPKPKLSIAGTYDFNDRAVKERSNQGSFLTNDAGFFETNITTIFADLDFKYKGFSVLGEYALRSAQDEIATNTDGTATGDVIRVGSGLNLQAGYLLKSNVEFAVRYTNINFDNITGRNDLNQYTVGVSKYIVGHKLKVQTDVSYLVEDNSDTDELMYRLQFDLHF